MSLSIGGGGPHRSQGYIPSPKHVDRNSDSAATQRVAEDRDISGLRHHDDKDLRNQHNKNAADAAKTEESQFIFFSPNALSRSQFSSLMASMVHGFNAESLMQFGGAIGSAMEQSLLGPLARFMGRNLKLGINNPRLKKLFAKFSQAMSGLVESLFDPSTAKTLGLDDFVKNFHSFLEQAVRGGDLSSFRTAAFMRLGQLQEQLLKHAKGFVDESLRQAYLASGRAGSPDPNTLQDMALGLMSDSDIAQFLRALQASQVGAGSGGPSSAQALQAGAGSGGPSSAAVAAQQTAVLQAVTVAEVEEGHEDDMQATTDSGESSRGNIDGLYRRRSSREQQGGSRGGGGSSGGGQGDASDESSDGDMPSVRGKLSQKGGKKQEVSSGQGSDGTLRFKQLYKKRGLSRAYPPSAQGKDKLGAEHKAGTPEPEKTKGKGLHLDKFFGLVGEAPPGYSHFGLDGITGTDPLIAMAAIFAKNANALGVLLTGRLEQMEQQNKRMEGLNRIVQELNNVVSGKKDDDKIDLDSTDVLIELQGPLKRNIKLPDGNKGKYTIAEALYAEGLWDGGGNTIDPTKADNSQYKFEPTAQMIRDTLITNTRSALDTVNSTSQLQMYELQQTNNKRSTAYDAASNAVKKAVDVMSKMISNF